MIIYNTGNNQKSHNHQSKSTKYANVCIESLPCYDAWSLSLLQQKVALQYNEIFLKLHKFYNF